MRFLPGSQRQSIQPHRDTFYATQDMNFDQALSFLNSQLSVNLMAEDVAEGVAAFFAKRPPEWKGR